MENKVRKIGRPLWDQILFADESEGYGICNNCDCIESGFPELYDDALLDDVACPNCTIGVMEPTGDLIVCGELVCIDSTRITTSVNIRKFLEDLFCDLDYDDGYTQHVIEIKRLLKDDDFGGDAGVHDDALRLMLDVIHSYDEYLN